MKLHTLNKIIKEEVNKYLFEINNFSTNDISKKEIITIRLNDRTPVLRFTRINSNKWKCDVLKKNNYLDDESLELNNSKVSELLKKISNFNSGIIFVLFGQQAQSFTPYINGVTNNIIKVKHPSYYVRIGEKMPREWFVEVNKLLGEKYGEVKQM
mgnify:CR=1 FL=1